MLTHEVMDNVTEGLALRDREYARCLRVPTLVED